jgi:ribulose 1,5-bisphosphate carboxylase large subunit-like protein
MSTPLFNIFRPSDDYFSGNLDPEKYVFVSYDLESTISVEKAAYDLSIGQSVGNPNIRNAWETDALFEEHVCRVDTPKVFLRDKKRAFVTIAFPVVNTDWEGDGIAHLMCQVLGGQADISHITRSRINSFRFPDSVRKHFQTPKYGMRGFRAFNGQYGKPLFGGIVKPKTGLRPPQLLDLVKEIVDGGVDFIKEDEILSNPAFCTLKDRVPLIANYIQRCGRKVIYCFAMNGDPHTIEARTRYIADEGGNGLHINFWSGLGAYHTIRRMDTPLFLHYQKSGDKVITHPGNAFGMSWFAMCQLAALCGVDSIHAGMYGGYMDADTVELKSVMDMLLEHNVIPTLSCGMHPGNVNHVTEHVGINYMANVGGALHGHPEGTVAGGKAMRQAIDHTYGNEYEAAIQTWGLIS